MSSASEQANGGANGLVLYASISKLFYPMCTAVVASFVASLHAGYAMVLCFCQCDDESDDDDGDDGDGNVV